MTRRRQASGPVAALPVGLALAFGLAAEFAPARAQDPAPTDRVSSGQLLEPSFPFPSDPGVVPGAATDFSRRTVIPPGAPGYGFHLVLRRDGWREFPRPPAGQAPPAERPSRLLLACRDLDAADQMLLSVDLIRLRHEVAPLDYLDYLAGESGWLELARGIYFRADAGGRLDPVANLLVLLPKDPKTGERSVARVGLVLDHGRAFVVMLTVRQSRYRDLAHEMATGILSFGLEQPLGGYAEPARTVPLTVGARTAQFDSFESWTLRPDVLRAAGAHAVGLDLPAGERLAASMAVAVYARAEHPKLTLEGRVRTVQAALRETFGVPAWTFVEEIAFAPSRANGPREGRVQIFTADEVRTDGKAARPGALELRIAWLWDDEHWVLAWLYTRARTENPVVHMVAKRGFSLALDSLQFR